MMETTLRASRLASVWTRRAHEILGFCVDVIWLLNIILRRSSRPIIIFFVDRLRLGIQTLLILRSSIWAFLLNRILWARFALIPTAHRLSILLLVRNLIVLARRRIVNILILGIFLSYVIWSLSWMWISSALCIVSHNWTHFGTKAFPNISTWLMVLIWNAQIFFVRTSILLLLFITWGFQFLVIFGFMLHLLLQRLFLIQIGLHLRIVIQRFLKYLGFALQFLLWFMRMQRLLHDVFH